MVVHPSPARIDSPAGQPVISRTWPDPEGGEPRRFADSGAGEIRFRVQPEGAPARVIVVFSDPAARAVQRVTHTIPIIAVISDLVASGLGTSLAKPGGNVTGVSMLEPELEAKDLKS